MLKVLVVDDEPAVRENLAAFLEDEGIAVNEAESGEHALAIVEAGARFDVCVMDMRLPGIDGNAAVLALHQLHPELQFLVHTGSANYSPPPALRQIGVTEAQVHMKPLADMLVLANAIREAAAR